MDSPVKKREQLKKSLKGTDNNNNNIPLTLVSPSERRDYGEDRVINLDV